MGVFDKASLALVPDGIKDGKLYSIKPTDGSGDFTFERGSNLAATRVDENGLIEKGRENLLKQSNIFNGSEWTKGNFSFLENQADKDGGTTAWKATCSTTYNYLGQNVSGNGVYTFSGYFRKGDSNEGVRFNFSASTDTNVYIDLTDGSSTDNGNLIYKSITAAGNGFYKVVVTANLSSLATVRFFITNGGTAQVSGNIYIQQFQIEVGLAATNYIETGASTAQAGVLEDLPRIDYTGGTPSLLLEPSRTNLAFSSETFGGSGVGSVYMNSKIDVTYTPNYGISPEGVKNSTRVQFNDSTAFSYRAVSLSEDNTGSLYVKGTAGEDIRFGFGTNVATDGTIHTFDGTWQRVTHTSSTGTQFYLSNYTGTGNQASDFEIYGLQHEIGSYATSYIPTYGAAATRSKEGDAFELSVLDFFSLGTSESGTFFLETKFTKSSSETKVDIFSQGGSGTNTYSGTTFLVRDTVGNNNFVVQSLDSVVDDYIKMIIRKDGTTFNVFINGVKSSTTNTITNPLKWFDHLSTYRNSQMVKQMLEFPEALSDAECITLTTL